jgi:hypothetical protein
VKRRSISIIEYKICPLFKYFLIFSIFIDEHEIKEFVQEQYYERVGKKLSDDEIAEMVSIQYVLMSNLIVSSEQ